MFWSAIVILIIILFLYNGNKKSVKNLKKTNNEFKKLIEIKSFAQGKVIDITELSDQVVSSKLLGDGIGIYSSGDTIYSPVDGVISTIFTYNNSLVINCDENIDIIVHIGTDTMSLEGEGFECFCKEGDKVKSGQKIIGYNQNVLKKNQIEPITYILVSTIADNIEIMKTKKESISLGENLMKIYYKMEDL